MEAPPARNSYFVASCGQSLSHQPRPPCRTSWVGHPAARRGSTGTRKVGLTAPNSFLFIRRRPRTPFFCSFSVTFNWHPGTHLWEERRWGFFRDAPLRTGSPIPGSTGCVSVSCTSVPGLQVSEASGVSAFQVQESEAQGAEGERRNAKPQEGGGRPHTHPCFELACSQAGIFSFPFSCWELGGSLSLCLSSFTSLPREVTAVYKAVQRRPQRAFVGTWCCGGGGSPTLRDQEGHPSSAVGADLSGRPVRLP